MRRKIGEVVSISKEMTIQTLLSGEEKVVKKGDIGFVDRVGSFHIMSGEASGSILLTEEKPSGYAVEDISKLIFNKLNREFGLRDILEENDVEVTDFTDAILDMLEDIFF